MVKDLEMQIYLRKVTKMEQKMSNILIRILLIEYIIVMLMCIYEKNIPKSLYWFGASILQISILLGMK